MSRSYWLPIIAAVGLIFLDTTAGRAATAHPGNPPANNAAKTTPSSLGPDIKRIAGALEAEARKPPSDYDRRNVEAQERVAAWTPWIAGIAAFEMLITAAGVVLVGFTLFHTRRAANAAVETVAEAKQTTAAAVRQANAAEATLAISERPYLFVENIRFAENPGKDWFDLTDSDLSTRMLRANVEYDLINYGKSPAIVRSRAAGIVIAKSLPVTPTPNPNDVWDDEIVISGGSARRGFQLFWRGTMTRALLGEIFLGRHHIEGQTPTKIWFFIGVRYESVAGFSDEIGGIWEYLIDIEQWIPYVDAPNYKYRRLGINLGA